MSKSNDKSKPGDEKCVSHDVTPAMDTAGPAITAKQVMAEKDIPYFGLYNSNVNNCASHVRRRSI